MLAEPWMSAGVTVVFAVAAGFSAVWLVRDRGVVGRVGHVLHLVMCLAMIAMAWSWGVNRLVGVQVAVFAGATLWYVGAGVVACRRSADRARGRLWHLGLHAVMMAAMVWMVAAMSGESVPSAGGGHVHGGLPVWSALIGAGFAVVLLAGAAVRVADAWIAGDVPNLAADRVTTVASVREGAIRAGVVALMSVGMVSMIAPMIQA